MSKKRVAISSIVGVVVVLVVALVITQVVSLVHFKATDIQINTYLEESYFETIELDYKEALQGLRTDVQLLSHEDYDFSNPTEYAHIVVFYGITTYSLLKLENVEFFVLDLGGVENRFMCKLDQVVMHSLRLSDPDQIRLDLYMYTKGLSDDDIVAMVEGLKLELQYSQGFLGQRSQAISVPAHLRFEHITS